MSVQLQFGLNRAIPESAKVAWGCRFIMERDGGLDFVWDRQSGVGENLQAFLDKLNELHIVNAIRHNWKRYYDAQRGYIPQNEDVITVFEGHGLKAVASTNASFGYVYCAVFEEARHE